MDGLDPTLIERAFRPIDTEENVGTATQRKRKRIIGFTFHLLDDHAALRPFARRGRSRDHHLERSLTPRRRRRLLRGPAPKSQTLTNRTNTDKSGARNRSYR